MIDIKSRIEVIRSLLQQDSNASLTYAALECRLTIEQICYDRLQISYGHFSHDDLKTWQPKHVVNQVISDANEYAASGFTLSISKEPIPRENENLSQRDFEKLEYLEVGKQAAINPTKLGSLWHALSRIALHVAIPADKESEISAYGNPEEVHKKVTETIAELERLEDGTLLSGPIGNNYSFPCVGCGNEIKRVEKLLKNGTVINCPSPKCDESYAIRKDVTGTFYIPRVAAIDCGGCGEKVAFPSKKLDRMRYGDFLEIQCEGCSVVSKVVLVPLNKPEHM